MPRIRSKKARDVPGRMAAQRVDASCGSDARPAARIDSRTATVRN